MRRRNQRNKYPLPVHKKNNILCRLPNIIASLIFASILVSFFCLYIFTVKSPPALSSHILFRNRSSSNGGIKILKNWSALQGSLIARDEGCSLSNSTFSEYYNPSSRQRYMTFVPTEGFTNQRIAIQHAAAFAFLANCVLVLPVLQSRGNDAIISDPFQQTPSGTVLKFNEIYDEEYFLTSMRKAGIVIARGLPKHKVLAWKHLTLSRDHSLKHNMQILNQYADLDNVVLDVGPTFLRFIPTTCSHVNLLWSVEDSLRLSPKLKKLVNIVKERLNISENYTCQHLRNEADAQTVWKHVENGVRNNSLLHNLPASMTYVASGSLVSSSLGISKSQVLHPHDMQLGGSLDLNQLFDVQAALDFQICADAASFVGPEFSAFSRLLLSKAERANKPNIMTHTQMAKIEILGTVAPAPHCDPQLLIRQSQFRQQVIRPNQMVAHEQYGDVKDSHCKLAANILSRILGHTMTLDLALARGNVDYLEQQTRGIEGLGTIVSKIADCLRQILYSLETKTDFGSLPIKEIDSMLISFLKGSFPSYTDALNCSDLLAEWRILIAQAMSHKRIPHHFRSSPEQHNVLQGMRILFYTHDLSLDGGPKVMFHFVKYLIEVGGVGSENVTILSPVTGHFEPEYRKLGVSLEIDDSYLVKPVARHDAGCGKKCVYHCNNYDLVVVNTLAAFPLVQEMSDCAKKIVWWIHESMRRDFLLVNPYLDDMVKKVSAAIFVSDGARSTFDGVKLPNIVATVPNYFFHPNHDHSESISKLQHTEVPSYAESQRDATRRQLGIGQNDLVVLSVGTVVEHKRQYELVHAFNSALNSIEDKEVKIHLVIVGFTGQNVEYERKIRLIAEQSKYNDRFHFLSRGEANVYFEAADLYVLPSRLESFGLTLLEASYANLPIITSGADGISGVINREQASFLPANWNETKDGELAKAIIQFHSNPNGLEARWASRRAKHRVENEYGSYSHTYTRILSIMLLSWTQNNEENNVVKCRDIPKVVGKFVNVKGNDGIYFIENNTLNMFPLETCNPCEAIYPCNDLEFVEAQYLEKFKIFSTFQCQMILGHHICTDP